MPIIKLSKNIAGFLSKRVNRRSLRKNSRRMGLQQGCSRLDGK
jgi:hypothetical protein